MPPDNEINVLNNVYENLKGLDNTQIKRILVWVEDKFDLEKHPYLKAVEREAAPSPTVSTHVESAEPAAAPVKKRRGRVPAKKEPVVEAPVPRIDETPVIKRFYKYDNFEELLLFSTAKTNIAKILLAGAFLQENKNFKEFGSYDIHVYQRS